MSNFCRRSGGFIGASPRRMGGRRRGRATGAYGVAVTLLPRKGGAVPESEKRRAAWRITEPSHTCLGFLLRAVPSPHILPTWVGGGRGGAAGAGAGCGAVRAIVYLASCCVCFRLFQHRSIAQKYFHENLKQTDQPPKAKRQTHSSIHEIKQRPLLPCSACEDLLTAREDT